MHIYMEREREKKNWESERRREGGREGVNNSYDSETSLVELGIFFKNLPGVRVFGGVRTEEYIKRQYQQNMEWVEPMEGKRKMSPRWLWCLYMQLTWYESHSVRSEAQGKGCCWRLCKQSFIVMVKMSPRWMVCLRQMAEQITWLTRTKKSKLRCRQWHRMNRLPLIVGSGTVLKEVTVADSESFLVCTEGSWE